MRPHRGFAFVAVLLAALSLLGGGSSGRGEKPAAKVDQSKLLYATLWMQGSGEYAAACRQTYNHATDRVKAAAAIGSDRSARKMAVVMDLDETVLDNSGYQAHLIRSGESGTADGFFRWAGDNPGKVGLVTGAKEFIHTVQSSGIRVVFVSNRPESLEKATRASLSKNGIEGAFDLHLRTDSYDKFPRFERVRDEFQVIAFVGDNLSDFPERFDPPEGGGPSSRRSMVVDRASQFGRSWFILPNPSYGDWVKFIEKDPASHLRDGGE